MPLIFINIMIRFSQISKPTDTNIITCVWVALHFLQANIDSTKDH